MMPQVISKAQEIEMKGMIDDIKKQPQYKVYAIELVQLKKRLREL